MANEFQIWALDGEGDVTPVDHLTRTESELALEDTLVKKPDMLMPKLKLIGRQTPAGAGRLDLLGLDANGQLVVFELKRGTLPRAAVTQVIDYASSLESMNDKELGKHIADRSGESGIERINDFDEWYRRHYPDQEASLRPVQMALVGLGAEADATRFVEFLSKHGVPISLITFHGYHHGGQDFLAKQVQTERDVGERVRTQTSRDERREKKNTARKALYERIARLGIDDFWDDVFDAFEGREDVITNGINLERDYMKLPGNDRGFISALSVRIAEDGKIRIIFFPVSIHLCRSEFDDSPIEFEKGQTNAPTTNEIDNQWYLDLDRAEWEEHKEGLVALADAVGKAWREAFRKWRKSKD